MLDLAIPLVGKLRSLRQTAIATVCISGTLGEKLPAASGQTNCEKCQLH
jgi:hypothetical protein